MKPHNLAERLAATTIMSEKESYDAQEFQYDVRDLIDRCIQEGIEPENVKKVLQHHFEGATYYYQDAIRYGQVDWEE